ncbi:MAG: LD-carboxypeptidase [Xanthomonadaceae bacterium]|nr:LD-carboxypeptidase [Xanthomonadaceae bacterium]
MHEPLNLPGAVYPGDAVGIIAPASPIKEDLLLKGQGYLQKIGYNGVPAINLGCRLHHVAGFSQTRLDDFHRMFANPDIKAIFAARGGYGSAHLLGKLDYSLLADNPKLLVGYSDITTLQLALWHKIRMHSISGPMVAVEMARPDSINEPLFKNILSGSLPEVDKLMSLCLDDENIIFLRRNNIVQGRLLGGTLSVISSMIGTPFFPDLNGAILIIEEHGERIYRLDRYLTQLRLAGVFQQVSMVIIGKLILPDQQENPLLPAFINDFFADDLFPVVSNFRYGHCPQSFIFPQGVEVEFNLPDRQISILKKWVA